MKSIFQLYLLHYYPVRAKLCNEIVNKMFKREDEKVQIHISTQNILQFSTNATNYS